MEVVTLVCVCHVLDVFYKKHDWSIRVNLWESVFCGSWQRSLSPNFISEEFGLDCHQTSWSFCLTLISQEGNFVMLVILSCLSVLNKERSSLTCYGKLAESGSYWKRIGSWVSLWCSCLEWFKIVAFLLKSIIVLYSLSDTLFYSGLYSEIDAFFALFFRWLVERHF